MEFADILAVIVATVVSTALGFAYYSPSILGKPWMKEMGLTPQKLESQKDEMRQKYTLSTVGTLINATVLAVILNLTDAVTLADGVIISLLVWLGFIATTQLTEVVFGGKTSKLFVINTGYQLISNIAMGIVIVVLS